MFTQMLADLSEDSQQVQTHFKQPVMDIFNSENFFLQSECILCKWQTIIRKFTVTNNELLDTLLKQYGQSEGLFKSSKSVLQ